MLQVDELLSDSDFYVVAETGLNDNFPSLELGFFSYNIYRCYQNYINTGVTRGAGIFICFIFTSKCLNITNFLVLIINKSLVTFVLVVKI